MSRTPKYQDTDAWREERRSGYGASDAPILVEGDEAAWRQLHGEKLGLLPDREGNELMEWGKRLEDAVADAVADRLGEPLVRVNRIVRHPELPYVFASLDRRRKHGDRRPVELKTVGYKGDDWGAAGSDIVPPRILYQVQQQAAVTGADAVDVGVLFTGARRLEVFTVGRDDRIIDEVIALETAAWAFVARGEMPPWPGETPNRIVLAHDEVELDDELLSLIRWHEGAAENATAAKAELDEVKDRMREVLADAGGAKGVLPDGRRVSIAHRPSEPAKRTDWHLVAQAYRKLIDLYEHGKPTPDPSLELDAIESMFTVTDAPRRPLRITIGKGHA